MKTLLVFPPGWMQFGPYLSLPLLKGFLAGRGIECDIADLNIEFYDWLLSGPVLQGFGERLERREQVERSARSEVEYAKIWKALLDHRYAVDHIEEAKAALRDPEQYASGERREWSKRVIAQATNVAEASFPDLRLTLNQIHFARCGVDPRAMLAFANDPENPMRMFYAQRARAVMTARRYDFVGFSLPAWEQLVPAITLASALRDDQGRDAHFCMGGNFITRLTGTWGTERSPLFDVIDSFSVNEGEESLAGLIAALRRGDSFAEVPNLVYLDRGMVRRTKLESLAIDSVPTPDFDGLPLERYFSPELILPSFTSRSCPYKCSFCTIPYASSEFRQRSAELVADDVEALGRRYGARLFTFVDETLTIPSLHRVSAALIDRRLDVRWYGETRFHPKFDRGLARQLFASGCRKLQFGLESHNQRVLDLMRKGTRLQDVSPCLDACLSEGIAVHLFTFIGFPGETEAEARETHAFSQAAMRRSVEQYGNDHSSIGLGAFGLDLYSDVSRNPQRYGVGLVPRSSDDDFFEIKYTTAAGLDHDQAEHLVSEFENRAAFEQVCARLDRVWWSSIGTSQTNEEEAFLLYAMSNSARMIAGEGPGPSRRARWQVRPSGDRASFAVAPAVEARLMPTNLFAPRAAPVQAPVLAFVHRERGWVLTLDGALARFVHDAVLAGALPAGPLARDACRVLDRLLRYELVVIGGERTEPDLGVPVADVADAGSLAVAVSDVVVLTMLPDRGYAVFDVVTEQMVRVNSLAALVVSVVTRRNRRRVTALPLHELERAMLLAVPQLPREVLHDTLAQLVSHDVLLIRRLVRDRKRRRTARSIRFGRDQSQTR